MKLLANDINKYFYFLILVSLYFLYYFVWEIQYFDFIYNPKLEIYYFIKSPLIIIDFLKFLKTKSELLMFLFVVKTALLMLLFIDKTRSISALIILILNFLFIVITKSGSPEQAYLNLIFLLIYLFPKCFNKLKSQTENFQPVTIFIIWLSFGLSYSVSGYAKYLTPTWQRGDYLYHLISSNYAFKDSFYFLINIPKPIIKFLNYFALLSEFLALPMIFFQSTRVLSLVILTCLHFGVLLVFNLAQVSLGMLIFHTFMFLLLIDEYKYRSEKISTSS